MCSGFICGVTTLVLGVLLVVASSIIGFIVIPNVVENTIINEVILLNDTIQLERFEETPFPINFTIRIFNITNPSDVLRGAVPAVREVGPYIYKLYQSRLVQSMDDDKMTYRRLDNFEFDSVASFPHTEDDLVHVANIAYHGVLQIAEKILPGLMPALSLALSGIFGAKNGPIAELRVGDLFFDGIKLCQNPGIIASVACSIIRNMTDTVQNMEILEDNTLSFSLLGYRNGNPGILHEVYRGIGNPQDMGRITAIDKSPYLSLWPSPKPDEGPGVCNMINGTDSGVFNPFVDRKRYLYAFNTDICRSVELRYQKDVTFKGIPAVRFSSNEWFLGNDDGCFCLNVTQGVTGENGCLLRGAQELYSCVGAFMVLTYPHFLYADIRYRNGVLGLNPIEDEHRIYLDLEPNTGTVIRGAKRAQFNVFMRPVNGIGVTQNLRTTLTPIVWVEDSVQLPDEFAEELTSRLLSSLDLVGWLVPVMVGASCAVLVAGVVITAWARARWATQKPSNKTGN